MTVWYDYRAIAAQQAQRIKDLETQLAIQDAEWDASHKKAVGMVDNLHARITKLREGILEAQKEGCACDFHLYAEDRDLLNDALLDVYLTQEQANREAKAEADRYRTALDRVWDALTAEDKRGAFTDTLWMPDNANITVFEFIDQTLNPK